MFGFSARNAEYHKFLENRTPYAQKMGKSGEISHIGRLFRRMAYGGLVFAPETDGGDPHHYLWNFSGPTLDGRVRMRL